MYLNIGLTYIYIKKSINFGLNNKTILKIDILSERNEEYNISLQLGICFFYLFLVEEEWSFDKRYFPAANRTLIGTIFNDHQ